MKIVRGRTNWTRFFLAIGTGALFVVLLLWPRKAQAVPSFARQTNLPCSACHTNPPELTPLGRSFKLNGYTMKGINVITAPPGKESAGLTLLSYLPVSVMFDMSDTGLAKPEPQKQNWNFSLPQDVGLFLAGAYGNHVGGFVQATYDAQADHFSWDNTDIRYAKTKFIKGKSLAYGIDLNNNPTVEDLWNDTPAWGFPWIASSAAPTPAAGAVIDGPLALDVAGIGGYAMLNNHLYGAATIYRSAHLGQSLPNDGTGSYFNVQGVAPYWRLAWQQTMGNNYLEFGTYGIHVRSTPYAVMGPVDTFTDFAFDTQYERVLPKFRNNLITLHGTYIRENSNLNADVANATASVDTHHLDTFRVNAVYHFGYRYAPAFEYFRTTGTADSLQYVPSPVDGSLSGSPDSEGVTGNLTYWPIQNLRLAVQYTHYIKFNGGNVNYDGFGRSAGNNNTIYLYMGVLF
ncbi:MAG TPA: hypothetical protein VNE63_12725 [Candidatus Acidoferrales bacterium]|nr:hypothetical protein [Candidatus Acidoferrales bacterium]